MIKLVWLCGIARVDGALPNDRALPYPNVCRPFRAKGFRVFLLFAFVPCCPTIGRYPILLDVAPSGLKDFEHFYFLPLCLVALTIGRYPILRGVAPSGLWYFEYFLLSLPLCLLTLLLIQNKHTNSPSRLLRKSIVSKHDE